MVSVYKLHYDGAPAGQLSNAANLQLPRAGKLKQIVLNTSLLGGANGDRVTLFQLAKNRALAQFETTIAVPSGILAEQRLAEELITANGGSNAFANAVIPCNEPINPNDTIYCHVDASSGDVTVDALFFVEE